MVSATDVAAGVEKVYDTSEDGATPHMHTVTVTAAHFATLAGGGTVMVDTSTDELHAHAVTIMCA
jgi:hypothetical protein